MNKEQETEKEVIEWIKKSIEVLDHAVNISQQNADKWMSELRKISKKEKLNEADIRTIKIYSENLNGIYNFETTSKIIPNYLKKLKTYQPNYENK